MEQTVDGGNIMKAVYPVSYTHLDVYKRQARKRGEQTGLDTLVVHAVNDAY